MDGVANTVKTMASSIGQKEGSEIYDDLKLSLDPALDMGVDHSLTEESAAENPILTSQANFSSLNTSKKSSESEKFNSGMRKSFHHDATVEEITPELLDQRQWAQEKVILPKEEKIERMRESMKEETPVQAAAKTAAQQNKTESFQTFKKMEQTVRME